MLLRAPPLNFYLQRACRVCLFIRKDSLNRPTWPAPKLATVFSHIQREQQSDSCEYTSIQANIVVELYMLLFAHCSLHVALCKLSCSLHVAHCTLYFALCTMQVAICKFQVALCTLNIALCMVLGLKTEWTKVLSR